MIRIVRLAANDPLLAQERALRERALLRSVGLDAARFDAEFPYFERKAERFVAIMQRAAHVVPARDGPRRRKNDPLPLNPALETVVVGCAALLPHHPAPGVGRLMQMAVDKQMRGQGIGRRLVVEIERRAFGELGLTQLFCHARAASGDRDADAVGFYERCGWSAEGEPFDEAGIPHRKVVLRG